MYIRMRKLQLTYFIFWVFVQFLDGEYVSCLSVTKYKIPSPPTDFGLKASNRQCVEKQRDNAGWQKVEAKVSGSEAKITHEELCKTLKNAGTGSIGPITKEEYDAVCGKPSIRDKIKWKVLDIGLAIINAFGDNALHFVVKIVDYYNSLKNKNHNELPKDLFISKKCDDSL